MAWRIHEHILRGEIDNRTRGRVTGRIWLAGVAEALVLDLAGDCHPDLAGCTLAFENPTPVPMTTAPPAFRQRGTAGDITAARKVRVFDIPVRDAYLMLKAGGTPPEHMANCLYLEWFSEFSGRVVIESTDYRLQVSEPAWRFTSEELAERARRAEEGGTAFATAVDADGNVEVWDEFRCEQLLRESDMTGEKYRRLLEQYADDPDSERIIAREMGWAWLDEALAAEERGELPEPEESDTLTDFDEADFEEDPPDPAREGIDWVRDAEERILHPVAKHARDLLYALLAELRAGGEDLVETDAALGEFAMHFMTLHVKLASALDFIARGEDDTDPGLIIAWLKRALELHNQTLTAAAALEAHARFSADRLAHYRAGLFQIREAVLAIIAELRNAR